MKDYISELAAKYGLPYEKMEGLVLEVVECVEKDLPIDMKSQIECAAGELLSERLRKEYGVFKVP